MFALCFFFSSRSRHTSCALVTGVQTCALPICGVDAAVVVEGDPFLLRQAVANLLDNAIDFAPRGSVVDIAVQREAGRVRIDVADRGPGVPDYAVGRVFERFYSLPRPDGESRSSGLGLCFVAQVAQLHDGDATLDNRDGGGTVASIDLLAIRT